MKKIEELKVEAKSILGEQDYEAALQMTIVELNRAYSTNHERFQDTTAKAYSNLMTVRMLGGR